MIVHFLFYLVVLIVKKFHIDPAQMIALREKMHLKERIVLCYLGGLQKWQCVEETLDIFFYV